MSRRSSRKVAAAPSYVEVDEHIDTLAAIEVDESTPKRRRTAKVEAEEKSNGTAIVAKSTPRKQPTKKGTELIESGELEVRAHKSVEITVTPRKRKVKVEEEVEVEQEITATLPSTKAITPKSGGRKRKVVQEGEEDNAAETVKATTKKRVKRQVEEAEEIIGNGTSATPSRKIRVKKEVEEDEEVQDTQVIADGSEVAVKKVQRKRKTKEEKEAEAMPLAARTAVNTLKKAMYLGAHISAAGGVHNSITNAVHIGGNAFALFLKSQRKWASPPQDPSHVSQFAALSHHHSFDPQKHVLPHGSYLVNLAQFEAAKQTQAYDCFLDDLRRCEALGISLYNFHPGNSLGQPRAEAIARIATRLNEAHAATTSVVTVLENMASGGDGASNVIGGKFEDLRDIIALVEDKDRVGVCLDTCHAFAAGYDLRSPQSFHEVMETFDAIVGLKYLKGLHLNDSKAPLGGRRDLHANIGTGFLGLRAFWNVLNFEPFQGLPMVLETPIERPLREGDEGFDPEASVKDDVPTESKKPPRPGEKTKKKVMEDKAIWAGEIKLLESLIGCDPDSEWFKDEEKRLWQLGEGERERVQGQVDRKVQKGQKTLDMMFKKASPKKGASSAKKRAKKYKKGDDEDSDALSSVPSDGEDHEERGCQH
jgi:AP endonuclease-1